MVLQAGANQRSEKLIYLQFSVCIEARAVLWQSRKPRSTNALQFVSSAGYLGEDEGDFLFREWSGLWECSSPTPPRQHPLWPYCRAFPCPNVLQETKQWPRCGGIHYRTSILRQLDASLSTLIKQPLLHMATRFHLLPCFTKNTCFLKFILSSYLAPHRW